MSQRGVTMKKLLFVFILVSLLFVSCATITNPDLIVKESYAGIDTGTMNDSKSLWQVEAYVDNFGNPTTSKYVAAKKDVEGVFSNSATTNSKAYAIFLVNRDSIGIQLYEYSMKSPVSLLSFENIYLSVRETSGNVIYVGYLSKSSDGKRFYVNYGDFVELMEAFARNNKLQFYFEVKSDYSSTDPYLFNVDTTGFVWAYKQAFGTV